MVKTKKSKVTVKEIESKTKVTEIKKESESEDAAQTSPGESELESITSDAPSAREFPEFSSQTPQEQAQPVEMQLPTPAATTETEGRNAAVYAIQRDVSEGEIRRVYNTRSAEAREIEMRSTMLLAPQKQVTNTLLRNQEAESVRTVGAEEERQYEVTPETKSPTARRKYPWEM